MEYAANSKYFPQILSGLIAERIPFIITTVTFSQGSTPQKQGSSAIWTNNGLIFGTIGGGSVENEASKLISTALTSKNSGLYSYNLTNDINDPGGSICGGAMQILLDASPEKSKTIFSEICKSLEKRESGVLLTGFTSSHPVEIERFWLTAKNISGFESFFPPDVFAFAAEML